MEGITPHEILLNMFTHFLGKKCFSKRKVKNQGVKTPTSKLNLYICSL